MRVEFQFVPGAKVINSFGEMLIIDVCGRNHNGITYLTQSKAGVNIWYPEKALSLLKE